VISGLEDQNGFPPIFSESRPLSSHGCEEGFFKVGHFSSMCRPLPWSWGSSRIPPLPRQPRAAISYLALQAARELRAFARRPFLSPRVSLDTVPPRRGKDSLEDISSPPPSWREDGFFPTFFNVTNADLVSS